MLLAFMVANEETHLTWREFLNSLQLAGVGTGRDAGCIFSAPPL